MQNGIKLKKTAEEEEDGMISNKKPRKATLAKDKLYGCFVKVIVCVSFSCVFVLVVLTAVQSSHCLSLALRDESRERLVQENQNRQI